MTSHPLPHVVIIGCGFGGLEAARTLAAAPVRITLIDRSNHHLFQPLLYQVATAGLAAPSIAAPIRHLLRGQSNLLVLQNTVIDINTQNRSVTLADGQKIAYDYLIVGSGATHSYFGHDEWARHAPGLKTLADAFTIRNKVLTAFEKAEAEPDASRRKCWLTFVVIGAGPTGVELAGTLAEIARHTLPLEFRRIDPAKASVLLIEGGDRVLSTYPPDLSEAAQKQLACLGVEVRLNHRVSAIDDQGIEVDTPSGRTRIASRTVLWAAGVAASPLGVALKVPLDRAGRVIVERDLTIPDHPEVFVIGDLAAAKSYEKDGRVLPVPGVSPAAKQMGRYAARKIMAQIAGRLMLPFRYIDYGSMATIGRKAAVAVIRGFKLSGFLAWLSWLFVHIYFLIGFRNRLVVFIDWAWAYWTFRRHARIVVEDTSAGKPEPLPSKT